MRLLEGLDAIQIRRLKWHSIRAYPEDGISARTINALAWLPGFEGDEMWAAHTEVVYRQWVAEALTILKDGVARVGLAREVDVEKAWWSYFEDIF